AGARAAEPGRAGDRSRSVPLLPWVVGVLRSLRVLGLLGFLGLVGTVRPGLGVHGRLGDGIGLGPSRCLVYLLGGVLPLLGSAVVVEVHGADDRRFGFVTELGVVVVRARLRLGVDDLRDRDLEVGVVVLQRIGAHEPPGAV